MADGGEGGRPQRPWIGTYILKGQEPVPEYDTLVWGRWMEEADRHVRSSRLGSWHVSTVFLGLDHAYMQGGTPILFETMVFKTDVRRLRRISGYKPEQLAKIVARYRELRQMSVFSRRLHYRTSYDYQTRCATWSAAILMHLRILRVVHRVRAHRAQEQMINWWPGE
jgi:hypothetical protein